MNKNAALQSDEIGRLFIALAVFLVLLIIGGATVQWVRGRTAAQVCSISVLASQKLTLVGEEHFGINCPKEAPLTIKMKDIEKTQKHSEEQRLKLIYAEKMRDCWAKVSNFLYPGSIEWKNWLFQEGLCIVCAEINVDENVKKELNGQVSGFTQFLQNTYMVGSDRIYYDYLYNDWARELNEGRKFTEFVSLENVDTIDLSKKNIVMFVKNSGSNYMAVKLMRIGNTQQTCGDKKLINQPPVKLA